MKKMAVVLFICSFCLMLTACDPLFFNYYYDELTETVASVELINYNERDVERISNLMIFGNLTQLSIARTYHFDKSEVLETVSEEDMDAFLSGLSEIELRTGPYHANHPFGVSLRIVYNNGDFDVLSHSYTEEKVTFLAKYGSDGKLKSYVGLICEPFENYMDLINNHFTTQVG